MTRDEAINRLWLGPDYLAPTGGHGQARLLVDQLAALGVLKLDAPEPTGFEKLEQIINHHAGKSAQCILGAIKNAKLKVTS